MIEYKFSFEKYFWIKYQNALSCILFYEKYEHNGLDKWGYFNISFCRQCVKYWNITGVVAYATKISH